MATGPQIGCVTVFGGSGFLGGEVVRRLSAAGMAVRVAVRHPDRVPGGGREDRAGETRAVYADVRDETSVALALEGADAAVNAVGLYVERGGETYEAVHALGARNVAHQAAAKGLGRLVHISGIGADPHSESSYVRARAKGELMVLDVFPRAAVLRPSVLFGPADSFLNALARIAALTPVLPLFGRGRTRLQPVYVGDVADAVRCALVSPDAPGRIYQLGGPRIYSYRALVELVLACAGRRRLLLPLPFPVWDATALFGSILLVPPITRAQVTLMKRDNVVGESALTFDALGLSPTALDEILPAYQF